MPCRPEAVEKRRVGMSKPFDCPTHERGRPCDYTRRLAGASSCHLTNPFGETSDVEWFSTSSLALFLPVGDDEKKPPENPEATKMLADARMARAVMKDFPGFTADMIVTVQSKEHRCTIQVDTKGKVIIGDQLTGPTASWAKRILTSAISHRMGNPAAMKTPCAFADEDTTHPLGRLVTVLNDELHSSYRIKDNQIMVVNRLQDGSKFSITVQANHKNEEGKFLPSAYSVNYWTKDGTIEKSEAHTQGWVRVNSFDLPSLIRTITTTKDVDAREIRLENIKLTTTP